MYYLNISTIFEIIIFKKIIQINIQVKRISYKSNDEYKLKYYKLV
jgi:hypothetical protein